jgi:Flp pilus assembly protein CpaB
VKASTLFALTVAVLLGLGFAVAAKTFGLFAAPPRGPDPVAAKKADILVLAAANNLFKGDLLDAATAVKVRALRPDELAHYNSHKEDYLQPNPQMVYLRVASANIETDQPILRSHLQELAKPELLPTRLGKNMRALNLVIPRDRAAGGMITVGEWVDVLVTSTIESPGGTPVTRTACVAPSVRVVAKRNTLWPVFAPLPEGKPLQFTLEVNPYRAALIDYVSTRGNLLLTPLGASDQKALEEKRLQLVLNDNNKANAGLLLDGPDDDEADAARIAAIIKGELAVGEADMARLFSLSTTPPPASNITIERFTGIRALETAHFTANGSRTLPPGAVAAPAAAKGYVPDYRFTVPGDCPTCNQNKKGKS